MWNVWLQHWQKTVCVQDKTKRGKTCLLLLCREWARSAGLDASYMLCKGIWKYGRWFPSLYNTVRRISYTQFERIRCQLKEWNQVRLAECILYSVCWTFLVWLQFEISSENLGLCCSCSTKDNKDYLSALYSLISKSSFRLHPLSVLCARAASFYHLSTCYVLNDWQTL